MKNLKVIPMISVETKAKQLSTIETEKEISKMPNEFRRWEQK